MNDLTRQEIQQWVEGLLSTLADDRQDAARHQCSELSRLVGNWVLTRHTAAQVRIAKGEFFDSSAHDVLLVEVEGRHTAVDPTVWQFFPDRESIYVAAAASTDELLTLLTAKYGGTWAVSEELSVGDEAYEKSLLDAIEGNL